MSMNPTCQMNQSMHSNNTKDNSFQKKIRLRSNTIFAFQEDGIYLNLQNDDNDQNDTYLIQPNNLNNSNFFSTICDRSQWLNLNNNHDDSMGSIGDDIEKDFRFLDEVDDDLNDAKLSLNEENSLSSTNTLHIDLATPIKTKIHRFIESEEIRNLNTNLNSHQSQHSQHSFSSFLNNGTHTSTGSSFLTIEDKKQSNNINKNNFMSNHISHQNTNIPKFIFTPRHFLSSNFYSFTSENNQPKKLDPKNNCNSSLSNVSSNASNTPVNYSSNGIIPIVPFKFNPNEDKSVLDNLHLLIKDQNGCRMIQAKLDEKKEDFNQKFFEKIKNNIKDIICDQFGNYVIQKFTEICNNKLMITCLMKKIQPNINYICTNSYGTRGFQRILDYISDDSDYEIIRENITNNLLYLIKDVNGNHAVQKIIEVYPKENNHFILQEITQNILEISKLKQGSCIFQKLLGRANKDDKKLLIEKIIENISNLINDEYGNFIIQHTVNLKLNDYNFRIFNYIKLNFISLAKQKYSSNVIDKCILFEDSMLASTLVDKLLELKCAHELIMDQYGNYVVQKALQVTSGLKFLEIIESIKWSIKILKQTIYGRKIYDKIMSNYGQYFNIPKQKMKKNITNITDTSITYAKKDNNSISLNSINSAKSQK